MKILRGGDMQLPEPCVLAIGKFESIHLGHRALIAEMLRAAVCENLPAALLVFTPHPYRVLFDPGYKPLLTDRERQHIVGNLGVDYLLEYPFTPEFAAMPPECFCQKIFNELRAQVVVVGQGYRFGYNRTGTVDTLRQLAQPAGAQIHVVPLHAKASQDTHKTSTSAIRSLLTEGKLAEAEALLGYPFFIMGHVTPGRQLGRTIGFPTINLYPPEDKFLPENGVYATRTTLGGQTYKSITNIGLNPTVTGENSGLPVETDTMHTVHQICLNNAQKAAETHIFGYSGDAYGMSAKVEFLRFIRPEQRFDSLDALKAQIDNDCRVLKNAP